MREESTREFKERLVEIQRDLKAPKDKFNSFGGYPYRTAEGILEAVKPFLYEHGLLLLLQDSMVCIGEKNYLKATALLMDTKSHESVETYGFAQECVHKGMGADQATGAASSYARKYALNALFLLDDTKDSDCEERHREMQTRTKRTGKAKESSTKTLLACKDCGNAVVEVTHRGKCYPPETIYASTGGLCWTCAMKKKKTEEG